MFLQGVEVYGAETLDNYTLSTSILEALEQNKILGVSSMHVLRKQDGVVRGSLAPYSFATIQVTKKKRRLTVHVTEQAQGGLVHINNKWSLYNLQGRYVRDLTEDEVLYVENTINGIASERNLFFSDTPIMEFVNQDLVLTEQYDALVRIKIFHDTLIREGLKPGMHIISDDQLLWAETRTREGDKLLYDVFRDPKDQVEQYLTVKKEVETSNTTPQVFDIRFDGRVFVR